ncbi:universal stress protein [Desulfothermus naphthae]
MADIKKILCAIDFGEMTSKVIDYGKTLGGCLNSKIYLIYVVHSLDAIEQFSVPKSYREEYEKQMIEQAKARIEDLKKEFFSDMDVEFVLKIGNPAKEILSFIESKNIDLVVIGAITKKDMGEFLFGSVGEKIIKLSKVPVVVIK